MAGRVTSIVLRASELQRFRAAVIDCAGPDERGACERLLGQLAFLEGGPEGTTGAGQLTFNAPPGSAALAGRALERMRSELFRQSGRNAAR